MTSRLLTRSDLTNCLKHDQTYLQTKRDVEKTMLWEGRLFQAMASGNCITRICAFVFTFFAGGALAAIAHDIAKEDKIHRTILSNTVEQQKNIFYRTYEHSNQDKQTLEKLNNFVADKYKFNELDREETAAVLTMINKGNFAELEHEAVHRIQNETGLSNISLYSVESTKSVAANDAIQFENHYEIRYKKSSGEVVTIGELTIHEDFYANSGRDHETGQTTYGKVNFQYNLDKEALKLQDTVDDFTIPPSTYKKYDLGNPTTHEDGLYNCTKDFIKSKYGIDCELQRISYNYDSDYDTYNTKTRTGVYNIIDPNSNQTIGAINAEGRFLLSRNDYNKIDFEASFNNRVQLRQVQKEQQDKRIQELCKSIL